MSEVGGAGHFVSQRESGVFSFHVTKMILEETCSSSQRVLQSDVVFDPMPYLEIYNEKSNANFCVGLVSAERFALRPSATKANSAKKIEINGEDGGKMAFKRF